MQMQLSCICQNKLILPIFMGRIISRYMRISLTGSSPKMDAMNWTSKSDTIGIVASALCFVHCLATPLLFLAQSHWVIAGDTHPWWWGILDLFFLGFSFFAVYWSSRTTSKLWVKYAFWALWAILLLIIGNEKMGWVSLPEATIYFPTLGLIVLHYYNRRYCRCAETGCCASHQ